MRSAAIAGWGMAVPARVVTNADLARSVPGIDEEWIVLELPLHAGRR